MPEGHVIHRLAGKLDAVFTPELDSASPLSEVTSPQGRFEARRFRPNIVVETAPGAKDFVENAWSDHTLVIGDAVRLRISGPCPRCVMTTLPQGDLAKDPGILRTAAQHNHANVGLYASVVRGGTVRRGDAIRVE